MTKDTPQTELRILLDALIRDNPAIVFSKTYCPYCKRVKELFDRLKVTYKLVELDITEKGAELQQELEKMTGQRTVPNVFIRGTHLGGCDDTMKAHDSGRLAQLLVPSVPSAALSLNTLPSPSGVHTNGIPNADAAASVTTSDTPVADIHYDYDVIVIGGGSGGISCARESARHGKKVAIFDYIVPTPQGTTWGLGGTCVNVGCIPKKLMHTSALVKEHADTLLSYGWEGITPDTLTHRWGTLVDNVQEYIQSLNFGYRVQLRDLQIDYHNALARLTSPNTVEGTFFDRKTRAPKNTKSFTARQIVISVGGRPRYPDIPGAREHGITSDDLFSLPRSPGKTLVVGASYVALECAGFLTGMGYDTTVMARSILLRGFDQQMAQKIGDYMRAHGTAFLQPAQPDSIAPSEDGRLRVTWTEGVATNTETKSDVFDTVVFAIGRDPLTPELGVKALGMILHASSGKIITQADESTSIPGVYAIGDVAQGRPELTPAAIDAGKLLARRLFAGSTHLMDYEKVPTTVFTPLEYGCCGLSEEDAIAKYGAHDIEVYHTHLKPLEWTLPHRDDNACYMKMICRKSDNMRVLGFHVLTPNAGEITMGFALALKLNATKEDFEATVGIHPTVAEEMVKLKITKSSGEDAALTGC